MSHLLYGPRHTPSCVWGLLAVLVLAGRPAAGLPSSSAAAGGLALDGLASSAAGDDQPSGADLDPLRDSGADGASDDDGGGPAPADWPSAPDSDGGLPLVLTCGALGSATFLAAIEIAQASVNRWMFGAGGAVLGIGASYLLTMDQDVSLGQYGYVTSVTLLASAAGVGLGQALRPASDLPLWLGLGGEAAGLLLAGLSAGATDWRMSDAFWVASAGLQGAAAAWGVARQLEDGAYERWATPAAWLSAAAVGSIAAALAPGEAAPEALPAMTLLVLGGGFVGGLAPGIAHPDGSRASHLAAGAVAGQALGWLASLALSSRLTLDVERAWALAAGLGVGAGMGFGAGAAIPALRGRGTWLAAPVGGLLGLGGLAASDARLDLDGGDWALVTLLTLGGGAGGAAGLRQLDLPGLPMGEAGWLAGALLGGGLGLGSGLLLGHATAVTPRDLTLIAGAATLGAAWGGLAPGYWLGAQGLAADAPLDQAWRAPASATGAALGALSMAVVAGTLGALAELEWSDLPKIGLNSLGASASALGLGLLTPRWDLRLRVGLVQAAGLASFGLLILKESGPAERGDEEAQLARRMQELRGALHGLGHGLLLPFNWRAAPTDRELTGGALVGLGAGTALFRLAAAVAPPHGPADQVEESLASGLLAGLGGGLGLLVGAPASDAALLAHLGGVAGVLAGYALSPHTDFGGARGGVLASGLAAGLAQGYWLALASGDGAHDWRRQGSGLLLGGAAGSLAAMGGSQLVGPEGQTGLEALGLFLGTTALPLGVRLLQGRPLDRDLARLELPLGLTALGAGYALAAVSEHRAGDRWLLGGLAVAGLTQGALAPSVWPQATAPDGSPGTAPLQLAGGMLANGGAGLVGGLLLSQVTDLSTDDVLRAGLLWAQGLGLGSGLALANPDWDAWQAWRSAQLGGLTGLGLGLGSALLPRLAKADLLTIGMLGASGALAGYNVPGVSTARPEARERLGAALAGASAAALLGTGLAHLTTLDAEAHLELGLWLAAGHGIGVGLTKLPWGRDAQQRAGARALAELSGLAAGLSLPWVTRYHGDAPVVTVLAGSALGLVHGLYLPQAWYADPTAPSHDEHWGGLLLGLGAGTAAGMLAAQLADRRSDEDAVGEALFWSLASATAMAGAGLLFVEDGRWRWGLFEAAGLAGLAGGALAGAATEFDEEEVGLTLLGAALGGTLGLQTWALAHDQAPRGNRLTGGALLGAGSGALAAAAASQLLEPDGDEVLEVSLTAAAGTGFGWGLGQVLALSPRATSLSYGVAGLGGLAAGLALAPHTRYDDADAGLTSVLTLYGGLLGAFAPLWRAPELQRLTGRQLWSGVALGSGLGLAGGLGLSQVVDCDGEDVTELTVGALASAAIGAGAGLLASSDDRVMALALQGGGLAGTAAVAALAPHTSFNWERTLLGTTSMAQSLWSGLGVALMLDASDRQVLGSALLLAGAGGLGGAYVSQFFDLNWQEVLTVFLTTVWGTWIGGWGGSIAERRLLAEGGEQRSGGRRAGWYLGATALGADAATVLAGLGISLLGTMDPERFAWVNVSGVGGMLLGLLVGGLTPKVGADVGIVGGSASGLLLGVALTALGDWGDGGSADAAGNDDAARSAQAWRAVIRAQGAAPGTTAAGGAGQSAQRPAALSGFPGLELVAVVPLIAPLPSLAPDRPGDGLLFAVQGLFY